MQRISILLFAGLTFAMGYAVAWMQSDSTMSLHAAQQQTGVEALSAETLYTYKRFTMASNDAADTLRSENAYTSGSEGLNYFAISVGGIDVMRDLEEGRGVDPETYAAVYADRASPEVSEHLDRDENGRWRYKGTVIRMYSRDRLKEMFQRRDQLQIRSRRVSE
jgi:hypothetical protein